MIIYLTLLISIKRRVAKSVLGLQQGGLPVSPPDFSGIRHCCSNWILRPSAYADHPTLCCLDFPERTVMVHPNHPSSQAYILYYYNFFCSITSVTKICKTAAIGTASKAPAKPNNLLPTAMVKITTKGFRPTAFFIT